MQVANSFGTLLFDWQVRRHEFLEAGAQEVWVIDTVAQRILRQYRGQQPIEIPYKDTAQTVGWRDESGTDVVVELATLFGGAPEPRIQVDAADGNFAEFNTSELARLQRFHTPWTIGHTPPQWFASSIADLLGVFRDELWDGILFRRRVSARYPIVRLAGQRRTERRASASAAAFVGAGSTRIAVSNSKDQHTSVSPRLTLQDPIWDGLAHSLRPHGAARQVQLFTRAPSYSHWETKHETH